MSKAEKGWKGLHPLIRLEIVLLGVGLGLTVVLAALGSPVLILGFFLSIFAFVLPTILVFFGFPVLIHELGHYFAARRLGLKVVGFSVLSIQLMRDAPETSNSDEFFGFVQVKTMLTQDRPEVWQSFLIAGPLAGLAAAVVETSLWWLNPVSLGPLFGLQALIGFVLTLSTLFEKTSSLNGDGEKMRDVQRADSQVFARTALTRLFPVFEGQSAAACDPEDVRRALTVRDPYLLMLARSIAASRATLLQESDALSMCRSYLDACEAAQNSKTKRTDPNVVRLLRQDAILELAFTQVYFEHDVQAAMTTMEKLDYVEWIGWSTMMRTHVAVAWAEGDIRLAHARIEAARAYHNRQRLAHPKVAWSVADAYLDLCANGLAPIKSI